MLECPTWLSIDLAWIDWEETTKAFWVKTVPGRRAATESNTEGRTYWTAISKVENAAHFNGGQFCFIVTGQSRDLLIMNPLVSYKEYALPT